MNYLTVATDAQKKNEKKRKEKFPSGEGVNYAPEKVFCCRFLSHRRRRRRGSTVENNLSSLVSRKQRSFSAFGFRNVLTRSWSLAWLGLDWLAAFFFLFRKTAFFRCSCGWMMRYPFGHSVSHPCGLRAAGCRIASSRLGR